MQQGHIYGKLNRYYSKAIKKYSERFIGLLQIDESSAYKEDQLNELNYCVNQLGLKGIYFEPRGLLMDNYKFKFYDDILWNEISSLSIPLYVGTNTKSFLIK